MVSICVFVCIRVFASMHNMCLFLLLLAKGCIALTFWRYHTQRSVTVIDNVETVYMRHIVGTSNRVRQRGLQRNERRRKREKVC